MKSLLIPYLIFGMYFLAPAQNTFSLGAKIGYGTSALPTKATLYIDGIAHPAKSGATISTGITGRYMIGDRIGIESGAWLNHYSFYKKNNFRSREIYWKSAADLEVLNYQMPVVLNYKLKFPRLPFTYFMLSGGTSIDWFFPDFYTGNPSAFRPMALRNLCVSIKRGREKLRGKFEFGVELQQSMQYFNFSHKNYSTPPLTVDSKLNKISLDISYFFFTKERKKADS